MKMKKWFFVTLLSALIAPTASGAWESGQELSKVVFGSTDSSNNGVLDYGEVKNMTESIAFSADIDDDNQLDIQEFMDWDFGFAYLAVKEEDNATFAAVKRIMFAVSDLNNDGSIDEREWRRTTRWHFERADLDNNEILTESEFLNGWTPIVMPKAGKGS